MNEEHFDVIVVGGGHAGAEAAAAAARLTGRVLLITSNLETVGQMSCNPAIGGVAKGTVVREVDAMGGVMGRATDEATIQFRMLNRSKGPAVWSPRAQCDRGLYRRAVRRHLEHHAGLSIAQGMVARLTIERERVTGVETTDGRRFAGKSVVLTAGTFLRGRIHIGTDTRIPAGRAGDAPSVDLAEQLDAFGLRVERFKTGTPPRIDGRSVDYGGLERQEGEWPEFRFSHYRTADRPGQVDCWLTWTGETVGEIIQGALHTSAVYGGEISGRGPRYCPSIEDKIVRFPDAVHHQVFLEPEGLDTHELYVNGLSTSLPVEVQMRVLHAIPGLQQAKMTRPGYAIEYDFFPPDQLLPSLQVKAMDGLFFAGQINGTTGYEEAAGQGIVAGLNAVRSVQGEAPVVITRDAGYIGVLIDDLVTKGVDEPYRLFTSRSEYRLLLRQDNALTRLGSLAATFGLLDEQERDILSRRINQEEAIRDAADGTSVAPEVVNTYLDSIEESQIIVKQKVKDIVKRPGVSLRYLLEEVLDKSIEAEDSAWTSAEVELKYAGYLKREREAVDRLREMDDFSLHGELQYLEMKSLSFEARQKLSSIQPRTLSQASRVPGISPSDLQNLVTEVTKLRRSMAQSSCRDCSEEPPGLGCFNAPRA